MPSVLIPNIYSITQKVEVPAAAALASCSSEFAVALAGCGFLAWRNEVERTRHIQPALFSRRVGLIRPNGIGGFTTHGCEVTTSGTLTQPTLATSSGLESAVRTRLTTAGGAGSNARVRTSAAHVICPSSAPGYNVGGFFFHVRLSHGTPVSGQRGFAGLYGTVGDIGNVEPNTLFNIVGFAYNAGFANLSIYHNDGSGAATGVAPDPLMPIANNVYDCFLFCGTNTSRVEYLMYSLQTGDIASGTLTSNLPDATVFLAPQISVNSGSTPLAFVDLHQFYWDSYF